jgi:hypothetical protein
MMSLCFLHIDAGNEHRASAYLRAERAWEGRRSTAEERVEKSVHLGPQHAEGVWIAGFNLATSSWSLSVLGYRTSS